MYTGKSISDGFDKNGEWWYSHCFGVSGEAGFVCNMRKAVSGYMEVAREALLWDVVFEWAAGDAVDRYLVRRVPLGGVADMSAGWRRTADGPSVNALGGSTVLLPAVLAKRQLLGYLRRTAPEAGSHPAGEGLDLDEAYEQVISTSGPVRFEMGRNTYWLTHDGRYSDRHRFLRHPHPDKKGDGS
ncbi:hypothetical protein ABZX85_47620 [Streptomyces sp. NPDC004539]|uniref:hypothetical protein n=1 Tax=Streptomyces sp. NPDC004539 TaxID=3154280 RepID=UPI0033B9BD85